MIEGKRLKNYLFYAIGEIVLVVIGIMVAVTINNYNESQKTEREIVKIAQKVKQKIIADLETFKETRHAISEDLKLYNLYLKKDKTESERLKIIFQAPFLVTINIRFLPVNPISSSTLDQATSVNTPLSVKLLDIEQDYNSMDRSLRPMENIIKDELINNLNYIKDKFNWYES